MTNKLWVALACAAALPAPALAQDDNAAMPPMNMPMDDKSMPGMNMGSRDHGSTIVKQDEGDTADEPPNISKWNQPHSCCSAIDENGDAIILDGIALAAFGEGSGTSRLPGMNAGMHGPHLMAGGWMVMAHGYLTAQYTSISGPRGDHKLYSASMLMLMGERETGWGRIQLKSMFSLEPAMDQSGYPSLFTTGETAHGVALIDRQHPHDLFMELAARVDFNAGDWGSLFLYGGPVGEPALGPSAFMHRPSAEWNPEPPITHHWFDSTHTTYGVVTAGLATRHLQLEASAFRGAEPDEHRWDIETPRLDSWAVRATWNPTPRWALQASYGKLHRPEAAHPGEDEHRFTTSAQYANGHGLSAMLAFSAKDRVPGRTLTAWLGEANWDFSEHDSLFGRLENVANDELFPDDTSPLHDQPFRVTKLEAGYARHFALAGPFSLTLGASGAAYAKPAALDPYYGGHPLGYTLFAKLSLGH